MCDGTGGMTGNGDSTGVHRSRNGKPHVKSCLLSHETRELVEQRYNNVTSYMLKWWAGRSGDGLVTFGIGTFYLLK